MSIRSLVVFGLCLQFAVACKFDSSATGTNAADADTSPGAGDASTLLADANPATDSAPGQPDSAPVAPDAPAPTYQVIETLTVSVNGFPRISSSVLANGETYRLRVSGTFTIGSGILGDAEYFDFSNVPSSVDDTVPGVDNGVAIDDFIANSTKSPHWGPFQPSHVYEIDFQGKGATISANLHDGYYPVALSS